MKQFSRLSIGAPFALLAALATAAALAAPGDIQLLPETVQLKPSSLPGFAVAMQKCAICHSADYVSYQPPGMNQAQWTAEMAKMQHMYGAPISDEEVRQIGAYLAVAYGSAKADDAAVLAVTAVPTPAPAAPAAAAPAAAGGPAAKVDVQALLDKNACLSCHGLTQKIIGPGYHEVAEKYKGDALAVSRLETSIRAGSVGKWGQAPMPAFATLKAEEVKALAEFVLKQ